MFVCHGPPSKDKLGSRPPFEKILSQGPHKEKRSVVDLMSNGTEVDYISVQNVNGEVMVLRVTHEQKRHHTTFSNWKHFRRIQL